MTSIPAECAKMRADLVERVATKTNLRVLGYMVKRAAEMGDTLFPPNYSPEQAADDLKFVASMAELFTCTPEMLDLVAHAAKLMPPQMLQREHLPSPSGFLWLPKPMKIVDINGTTLSIYALLWHEETLGGRTDYERAGRRGVIVWAFTLTGAKDDALANHLTPNRLKVIMADTPRLGLLHVQSVGFGMMMWNPDSLSLNVPPEERARAIRNMRDLQDGVPIEGSEGPDGSVRVRLENGSEVRMVPDGLVQFLSAYLHFCRSKLTGFDTEFAPRSSASWLRRLGLANSPITVLRLRQRERGKETGRGVVLSYRYIRRGTWRRQPYGPRANPHYEYIWIEPCLVGDESLPLRVRDVVNTLVR